MPIERRLSIVVTTHNRRVPVMNMLSSLGQLPGNWPVIVIDNGSTDGTAAAVAERFPSVMLIRARRNLGVAARNIGAAYAHTPYIAFCDDDIRWDPGALERAAAILDAAPDVAVLNACVQIGLAHQPSPICTSMAQSPLPRRHLPGPRLLDFMAGACVVRTRAFIDVGGYWPPFFMEGVEALMAMDMEERGWHTVYAEDVISRRFSCGGATLVRERRRIRNDIWLTWMRRPLGSAWRRTRAQLGQARVKRIFWRTLADVALGMPRVLRQRRVISPTLENMRALLDAAASCELQAGLAPMMPSSPKY